MIKTRSNTYLEKSSKITSTLSILLDDIANETDISYKIDLMKKLFEFMLNNSYFIKNCDLFISRGFYKAIILKVDELLYNTDIIKKNIHFRNYLCYFKYRFITK